MWNYSYEERQQIREAYKNWKPYSSPYDYCKNGWDKMTPIENNVWSDIRYLGLRFYPQYPIGKYFVDFADPQKKIVIEVDGHDYHQDKERDLERQVEIAKLGWDIHRIDGKETYGESTEYLNQVKDLYLNDPRIMFSFSMTESSPS